MGECTEPAGLQDARLADPTWPAARPSSGERAIWQYLSSESNQLLRIIRGHVSRANFWWRSRQEEVAQELLSEVALEAIRSYHRFDPIREVEPWIRGIALNCVRRKMEEFVRRQKELLETELSYAGEDERDDVLGGLAPAESPETHYSLHELEAQFGELTKKLTPTQQKLVNLRLQGFSYKEVALEVFPNRDPKRAEVALRVQLCRLKGQFRQDLRSDTDE